MKTLYLISKGMGKQPDDEIRKMENEDLHPRVSFLEETLEADVLDERYLASRPPIWRRHLYRWMPVRLSQIIETLCIHSRYDVILAHTEQVSLPLALIIRALRIRTPYVITVSRITSMYKSKTRLKKWMLKHSQMRIDRILMWSSSQRRVLTDEMGIPKEKISLVRLGTDQQFWRPLPGHSDRICAVGMEMRDYPTLIKALNGTDIPCHLAIGHSRGELFETIRRVYELEEIPANITIGSKTKSELRELYADSRFLVIPLLATDSDNGQTSILESMAMGKPVICSRVDGQLDLIEDGVTGFYVPQGDPVALREMILNLWEDTERIERMGRSCRSFIEEKHTVEAFAASVRETLEDAVRSRTLADPFSSRTPFPETEQRDLTSTTISQSGTS